MKHLAWAVSLIWASAAHPVGAQERSTTIELNGDRFTVPLPAGYCSDGPGVRTVREHEGTLGGYASDVVMAPCGDALTDTLDVYTILVQRDVEDASLEAVLADFEKRVAGRAATLGPLERKLAGALGKMLEAQVTVKAQIAPIGTDDTCGYAAGVNRMGVSGGAALDISGVTCTTVIHGRIVHILRMRSDAGDGRALAMATEVRNLARAIR